MKKHSFSTVRLLDADAHPEAARRLARHVWAEGTAEHQLADGRESKHARLISAVALIAGAILTIAAFAGILLSLRDAVASLLL